MDAMLTKPRSVAAKPARLAVGENFL